jgi:hypothetical protein
MARPGRAQPMDGLETGGFVLAFAGARPTGWGCGRRWFGGRPRQPLIGCTVWIRMRCPAGSRLNLSRQRPVMPLRPPSGSGSRPRMRYREFAARQAAELGRWGASLRARRSPGATNPTARKEWRTQPICQNEHCWDFGFRPSFEFRASAFGFRGRRKAFARTLGITRRPRLLGIPLALE